MKSDVKKLNSTKCVISVEVPREKLKEQEKEVFKSLNSQLSVSGFRKGKAPFDVFVAQHRERFENELVRKCIPVFYDEAMRKHGLTAIDYPSVKDVRLRKDSLVFSAEVEIKPQIKIDDTIYKKIPVKYPDDEIKAKEVDRAIENLIKVVGDMTKKKYTPLEFAKFSGYTTEEKLRLALKNELFSEKVKRNRAAVEDQIVNHLLKKVTFSVPESILARQIERNMSQELQGLRMRGVSENEIQKHKDELEKKIRPIAQKQLKMYFIMEEIVGLEGVDKEKVKDPYTVGMGIVLQNAKWDSGK